MEDVLKETVTKQTGLANLKAAVNDLSGKMSKAQESHASAFVQAVGEAGNELSGLVDDDTGSIKVRWLAS